MPIAMAGVAAGAAAGATALRAARRRDRAWTIAGADGPIEIRRDDAGVPHVRGASAADALRGLGYCHGVDRPVQIVLARLIGQGRAAEALGASEELVAFDKLFRRLDLGREAEAQVALLRPRCREQLEAYCSGVSDAFSRSRPWELALLRHRPDPWRPADCVTLARLMGYLGLAQTQGDMERILVELVQGGIDEALLAELLPGRLELLDVDLLREVQLGSRVLSPAARQLGLPSLSASNAWAVAPERTRSGSALLASDPHLDVNRLPAVWYEALLDHGERWCAGATMPGLPAVLVGRSADLAWGLTYGGADAIDSWVEECRGGRFMREVDGERQWLAFRRRDELVLRRGISPLSLPVFENEHGVLDGDPRVEGRYLCTRWAAAHGTGAASLAAMLELPEVRDVDAAAGLLRNVEFSFNWVLADREGSIAHQMSGRIPRRRRGNGLIPLPGWDPAHDWDGYLAAEELPRVAQPREALAGGAGIGILAPHDHPGGARCRDQVRARRSALRRVSARFERHKQIGALRSGTGFGQSHRLGMRASARPGPAPPDHPAVLQDNAPDCGVRPAQRSPARGEACRGREPVGIPVHVIVAGRQPRGPFSLPRPGRGRSRAPSRRRRARSHGRVRDRSPWPPPRAASARRGAGPARSGWRGSTRRSRHRCVRARMW